MASTVIRFAVADGGESCSSIWRLWANRNDLYLATRTAAGLLKISFHKRIHRAAEVSTAPRPALARWERRPEMCPGWTFCFGIIVPPPITARPFREAIKHDKPILVVPPPMREQKAIFQILFSTSQAEERDLWNLNHPKEVRLLGRIRMPREQAWLTIFYDNYSAEDRAIVAEYFGKLTINLGSGSKIEDVRGGYLHMIEARGTYPHLIDIQLGEENVRIEGES